MTTQGQTVESLTQERDGYIKKLAENVKEMGELRQRLETTVCGNHQWPYGAESTDGPICPWCERLRVEELQQQLAQAQATRGRCKCSHDRKVTELGFWEHCPLEHGCHTEFFIQRCEACGKIHGFPDTNLSIALEKGTSEVKAKLNEIINQGWLPPEEAKRLESERDEARASLSKLKATMSEGLRQEQKLIQRSEDEWNDKVKELEAELKERNHEITAINTGIRNEFTTGEPSGDVLQDFATFFEHHNQLEAEAACMRKALQELRPHFNHRASDVIDFISGALSTEAGKDFLAKMERYEEALQFYADENHYKYAAGPGHIVDHDGGRTAREALKGDSTP